MDFASIVEKLMAFWKLQESKGASGNVQNNVQSDPETNPAPVSQPETIPAPSSGEPSGIEPLGIRNNNPGNLRPGSEPWVGQVRVADGFCVFDTAEHGIRALAKLLVIYQDRYGCATVASIITRWAPPSENNTTAYINAVCADTGFGRDDWLHMHEPSVLQAMTVAIIKHENGQQPYTDMVLAAAVKDALA